MGSATDAFVDRDDDSGALPPPGVSEAQRARVRARLFGTAAVAVQAPLVGGKYRRLALLGEGGIGTVWEVEHVVVGKRFALKMLKEGSERVPQTRRRFLREARAASMVGHENIVEVTDAGEADDGTPYVVMELLRGQTLAQAIEESGPMPWPRVREILRQLASALARAHSAGIVHRDLKPENVMLVARGDRADFCKIVDFGLVKMLDPARSQHTRPGSVAGTPATMSPEQIRGEEVDGRTDVYALGCIAYQMLTGRRPYAGPTPASVLAQHLSDPPPRLGEFDAKLGLRPAIEDLVQRAMAKDREARLASMDAVLDAVEAIETGGSSVTLGVEAAPIPDSPRRRFSSADGDPARLGRWRPRAAWVVAGGICAALAAWAVRPRATTTLRPIPAPEEATSPAPKSTTSEPAMAAQGPQVDAAPAQPEPEPAPVETVDAPPEPEAAGSPDEPPLAHPAPPETRTRTRSKRPSPRAGTPDRRTPSSPSPTKDEDLRTAKPPDPFEP